MSDTLPIDTSLTNEQLSQNPDTEQTSVKWPISEVILSGSAEYKASEIQKYQEEENPLTGIVEHHYKNASGNRIALIGTSHRYDADDPAIDYLHGVVASIPAGSHKVLILEGQYENDANPIPVEPEEAVRTSGGEFGYMASLANQRGVEWIPAEPDPRENAKKILEEHPEVTRNQLALHYGLKTLVGIFRQDKSLPLSDVAPYIHHTVGAAGNIKDGGWVSKTTSRKEVMQQTEDERALVMTEIPAIINKLNAEFAKIKPGETLLELSEDGILTNNYDLDTPPILWDPSPQNEADLTVISQISQYDMLMRDRHTMELAMQALASGKEPIIAVGSSHVSTLKPAFDRAFISEVNQG
jgi:hypothetical protein